MTWQPIETAPKDRRVLLYWPEIEYLPEKVACGKWDSDEFAKRPNPFWAPDWYASKSTCRHWKPTHWMELPEGPRT